MSGASDRPSPGRPFRKGQSGNPGGRTKAAAAMQRIVPTLIAELTNGGADLVYLLLRIAAGAEPGMDDARSRFYAVRELLDRGVGRPALSLKVDTGPINDAPRLDDRNFTDDELRVLSKLDGAAPAKVLQLVPIPATAMEAPPGDDGSGAG